MADVTSTLARIPALAPMMASRLSSSFEAFAKSAFSQVDPARLQWSWHHALIAEYLELAARREIKRLCICVPPRGLKSKLVSVLLPAYIWSSRPSESFIVASHSSNLSTELSIVRRTLLESAWYRRLWPGVVEFRGDQNRMDDYANSKAGRMLACGMENPTGRGCSFLLIDDPLTPAQAFSELERASALRAFNSGLRNRLNSPGEDVIIVIAQRLHRADLVGSLMDSGEAADWSFLVLPMVEPHDRRIVFPVSGRVIERHAGDLLHPQRWSARWCTRERESVGPFLWAAQYLQNPTDPSAAILKREFWRYWTYAGAAERPEGVLVRPDKFDAIVIAGDLAFTSSSTSDRVALGVFARAGNFTYLLALEWARLDFQQTLEALRRLVREYPNYSKIVIEKAANASALLSSLQQEIPGITLLPAQGSKQARYHAISAICARNEVVLPHRSIHRQSDDLVSELEHAGVASGHDDAADCLALGVSTIAAMAGGTPPPWAVSDDGFGIGELRRFLDGKTRPGEISASTHAAVTAGKGLSDAQIQEILGSTIPGGLD